MRIARFTQGLRSSAQVPLDGIANVVPILWVGVRVGQPLPNDFPVPIR